MVTATREPHAAATSADESHERHSPVDIPPLQFLLIKAAVITFSGLLFVYGSMALVVSAIDDKIKPLTGGPAFWRSTEEKLHQLAIAPDLPPEKKEKIIQSLRAISAKYRPYIDALKE